MDNKRANIVVNMVSIKDSLTCLYELLAVDHEDRLTTDEAIASSLLGLSNFLEKCVEDVEELKLAD